MSFLDATGLGTFWAKLKNYFLKKSDTDAPVTGLTDILSPVNLMPNSEFRRTNTSSNPQTIGTLNTTFVTFADYWQIQAFSGTCSNVTLSVEKNIGSRYNLLSISGTVATTSTNSDGKKYVTLRVRNTSLNYYRNDHIWYTDTFKLEKVDSLSYTLNGYGAHSGSEGGAIRTNGLNVVNIFRTSGADTLPYFCMTLTDINEGDTFQIRLYDCATYLGSYRNPPVIPSLDGMPGNQFLLQNGLSYCPFNYVISNTTYTANKWNRVFYLGKKADPQQKALYKINITSNTTNVMGNYASIMVWFNESYIDRISMKLVDQFKGSYSSTLQVANSIQKIRIAVDSSNRFFVEVFSNATNFQYYMISATCLSMLDNQKSSSIMSTNSRFNDNFSNDGSSDTLSYGDQEISLTY